MEEEFQKINQTLDDFYAGKVKDRNELIKAWLSFLDSLKEASQKATEEDKEHYRRNLGKLANRLAEGFLILTKDTPLADKDIYGIVENPDNFDPKAWNELKELKSKLDQRMKILVPILAEEKPQKRVQPKKSAPLLPKPKNRLNERRRRRRSGWLSG